MNHDSAIFSDAGSVAAILRHHDAIRWHCRTLLRKFDGDFTAAQIDAGVAAPNLYDVIESEGNLLVTVGATILFNGLIGTAITAFSNANAHLNVGDGNGSVPTPLVGDTDLTAPTNKLRKAMDATFPTISTNTVTFRSTYATADANWAWREWSVHNASSAGTMLNKKGEALGTKVSTATWQFSVTCSLA